MAKNIKIMKLSAVTFSVVTRSLALGLGLLLMGCQPDKPEPEVLLAKQTTAVVKPFYDDLMGNLDALMLQAEAFCQAPSPAGFQQTQSHWRQTMGSWQAASVVDFGPVTLGNMAWKFQFWPDRKNLIRQKVEKALDVAKQGGNEWSSVSIAKTSVVARGLGAAEYLLFDADVSEQTSEAVRCQYLLAIIGDMQRNAKRVSRGWQEGENRYPQELLTLAMETVEEENGYFEADNHFQVSALLVGSLHTTLETTIRKLTMPLGKEAAQAGNPYMAESWRSGTSLENLRAVLQATQRLYSGGDGYGLDDRLAGVDEEGRLIAEEVRVAYREAALLLDSEAFMGISLADAVIDQQRREEVRRLANRVSRIKNLFAGKVPDKLGIPLGFNSNDGD